MKIVIEGLGLTAGGGKRGLLRLLPRLAGQSDHTFVALLARSPDVAELMRPNLKLVPIEKPSSLLRRHRFLQRDVPRICARERADALLCLGNFGPRRLAIPSVVLLHNAHLVTGASIAGIGLTLREKLINGYGRRYLNRLPAGTHLVVQTALMKQRLVAAHRVPAARVTVIPDGDGLPEDSGAPVRADAAAWQRLVASADAASGGEAPFTFLCLARYYPHKNLEVLVEAMRRLAARVPRRVRCVLTLAPDEHRGARRLLLRLAAENLESLLANLGPLAGRQVTAAYAAADAFILPTLLESFGRTYLEAMSFGLPVLTSDRDFARDACGDAALYFDPLDPASVAQSMETLMADAALRARLSAAGRRRAERAPSWDRIAASYIGVLERVASGRASEPAPVSETAESACCDRSMCAGPHAAA